MNAKSIILVDDDEDECILFTDAYHELALPNELLCFQNGKQLIDHLQTSESQPFLIFSDIHMPLVDGLELRQHLIDDASLNCRSVPFVFLTTTAGPADITKAYDIGIQGIFRKGRTSAEIQTTLSDVIGYWQKCMR